MNRFKNIPCPGLFMCWAIKFYRDHGDMFLAVIVW